MALSDADLASAAKTYVTSLYDDPNLLAKAAELSSEAQKIPFVKQVTGYDVDAGDIDKMRDFIQKNYPDKWDELTKRAGSKLLCTIASGCQ